MVSQSRAFEKFLLLKNEQSFNDVVTAYKVRCKIHRNKTMLVS